MSDQHETTNSAADALLLRLLKTPPQRRPKRGRDTGLFIAEAASVVAGLLLGAPFPYLRGDQPQPQVRPTSNQTEQDRQVPGTPSRERSEEPVDAAVPRPRAHRNRRSAAKPVGRGQDIILCRHRDCYLGHRFLPAGTRPVCGFLPTWLTDTWLIANHLSGLPTLSVTV